MYPSHPILTHTQHMTQLMVISHTHIKHICNQALHKAVISSRPAYDLTCCSAAVEAAEEGTRSAACTKER